MAVTKSTVIYIARWSSFALLESYVVDNKNGKRIRKYNLLFSLMLYSVFLFNKHDVCLYFECTELFDVHLI